MYSLNALQIYHLTLAKAQVETDLLKALNGLFMSDDFLIPLRGFVGQGIHQVAVLGLRDEHQKPIKMKQEDWNRIQGEEGEVGRIRAVCKSEKALAVWGRHGNTFGPTPEGLRHLLKKSSAWTMEDCGSLIRLYAKFVKGGGDQIRSNVKQHHDQIRSARAFDRNQRDRVETKRTKEREPAQVAAARRKVVELLSLQGGTKSDSDRNASMGMRRWTLLGGSAVRKIDIVFGLAGGGDISGTTAGTTFFIEHVSDFFKQAEHGLHMTDREMQFVRLLPLATIAAQGHHTLLEVAYALTVEASYRLIAKPGGRTAIKNKSPITYTIGTYSSLLPLGFSRDKHPFTVEIENLLTGFEGRPGNHRMICWHTKGMLKGLLFKGGSHEERSYFEKMAKIDHVFTSAVPCFADKVTEENIKGLATAKLLKWPPPFEVAKLVS